MDHVNTLWFNDEHMDFNVSGSAWLSLAEVRWVTHRKHSTRRANIRDLITILIHIMYVYTHFDHYQKKKNTQEIGESLQHNQKK